MHELCRRQHATGSRDFSLPAIGRLAEAEGILKGRALYNAPSADYRSLIEAWAAYAGPVAPKPPRTLASHDYLTRIEDPTIRSIMQAIVAERDKLKAQLNVLKANTQVTVDRRPLGATVSAAPGTQPAAVLALSAQLTSSEREALQKAVSARYLEERGLKEATAKSSTSADGWCSRWASLVPSARYWATPFSNFHEKAPTATSAFGNYDALRCICTSQCVIDKTLFSQGATLNHSHPMYV